MAGATFTVQAARRVARAVVRVERDAAGDGNKRRRAYAEWPASALVPVGCTVRWCAKGSIADAPDGWLICDGSVYNISDYPVLGALLGSTFGGDGLTTFAVPDTRERVHVGFKGAHADYGTVGATGGSDTHAHNDHTTTAHSHDISLTSGNGAPSIGLSKTLGLYAEGSVSALADVTFDPNDPTHSHSVSGSTGNAGNETLSHNSADHRPKWIATREIIRAR